MAFDRTIDVTVPHNLGIRGARERLLKMLGEQKDKNPHITHGDFAWHSATNTFTVDVMAYGYKAHVIVGIESDAVTVHSTDVEGFFAAVWLGVLEAEREIGNMLREALK